MMNYEKIMKAYTGQGGETKYRKKPVPLPVKKEILLELAENFLTDEQSLALWCYLYLTATRISEPLGQKKNNRRGLAFRDLEIIPDKKLIIVTSYTEKNHNVPFRKIPIALVNSTEERMAKHFMNYATTRAEADQLFTFTRQKAYNEFTRKITMQVDAIENLFDPQNRRITTLEDFRPNPHYLRHCRLTHLVEDYHYDSLKLMSFAGWSSPAMASTYVHFDWQSLVEPLISKNANA